MQEAVGEHGKLLTDFCPLLEKIIGKQPDVVEVGTAETEIRFYKTIIRFVKVFTQQEHSLVIFIDDLQWADLPSLRLFQKLAVDRTIPRFLLIGAYRDNEIDAEHILTGILGLSKEDISLSTISLQNLGEQDVRLLIVDALHMDEAYVSELAQLLYLKTGGNPFYIRHLLISLYEMGFLYYDPYNVGQRGGNGEWGWQVDRIRQLPESENVADLMMKKVEQLPLATQNVLKMAACLGNYIYVDTLELVMEKPLHEMTEDLKPALR